MADVWLVETSKFGAPMRVVLKTMRSEIAGSRDLSRMFVEEALVASKLHHENIVKVLDAGAIDGRHYIAMEYVRGCTLRQIAQRYHEERKRVEPWFLLRIVLGACAALEYVHGFVDEEGWPLALVHGDVSPENIMVSFSGVVKLVDFGVTRAETAGIGMVVGKPWYMAPERIQSGSLEARSDLYALGVILYEFLTGYRPYSGESEADVMASVIEGRPAPMEELAKSAPPALRATTLRAMALEGAERFPSAAHLAAEIRARLRELDVAGLNRPIDVHMAHLFGDRDPVASSVRLSAGDKRGSMSELPTVPSDPAVVGAALALVREVPKASKLPKKGPPPLPKRSGTVPAQKAPPDIFATQNRPAPPLFGRGRTAAAPAAVPRVQVSPNEREAAHLFDIGLAAVSTGDLERAVTAWREAVALHPAQRLYESNLRRLEQRLARRERS
jgi:serine/threonine protein kinase